MEHSKQNCLSQFLDEDQEPFVLQNYINEKRLQLKNSTLSNHSGSKTSTLVYSPFTNPSTLFVHIPSPTAALLLEAALRIQKQDTQKSKTTKNLGFGLFGSILNKITRRKGNQGTDTGKGNEDGIRNDEIRLSVKDILRWESLETAHTKTEINVEELKIRDEKRVSDVGFSFSSWSETNEEKSLDYSEASTSRSYDYEDSQETEISSRFVSQKKFSKDHHHHHYHHHSPEKYCAVKSPGVRSRSPPGVEYPATSPNRHKKQVVENAEEQNTSEKEKHNSPVSVLDPQFEGDDDEGQEDEQEEDNDSDLERSFAFVHRAREKLLDKLRRFELLAELDPVELEKRIAEEDDDDEEEDDNDSSLQEKEKGNLFFIRGSKCSKVWKAPLDMRSLVEDLKVEEGTEPNALDMMMELDLRGEGNEWKKYEEDVEEAGVAIELAIFSFLVEELSVELCDSIEN